MFYSFTDVIDTDCDIMCKFLKRCHLLISSLQYYNLLERKKQVNKSQASFKIQMIVLAQSF